MLTFWRTVQKNSLLTWTALLFCFVTLVALSYRIDVNALQSFDEAWYADITRSLVRSKNPLRLEFNQAVFTDHPPFGYMLMAIPTAILGSTELSTRLVSVVLSTATVAVLILIGKELKTPTIGYGAALILLSCLWYVLRARSGNLDAPFVFWETLTVLFALRVKHSPRSLFWLALSFSALILTKTVIGIAVLPVVLLCLWAGRGNVSPRRLSLALLILLLCVLPWYAAQIVNVPGFLLHHFVEVGARGDKNSFGIEALLKNLMYIRSGIGKWFYVFWLSLPLALGSLVLFPKHRWNLLLLLTWTASFGLPFLISSHAEIWHFIPVYPAAALLISYTAAVLFKWGSDRVFTSVPLLRHSWLIGIFALSLWQFQQMSSLLYPVRGQNSNEQDIAQQAQAYPQLVLMETFYPALVYYSGSKVEFLLSKPNSFEEMVTRLQSGQSDVFVVSHDRAQELVELNVPFVVLEQNSAYAIIQAPQEGT